MKVAQENVAEVNEEVEHVQVIDVNIVNQEVRQEDVVNQDIEVDQGVVIVPENEANEVHEVNEVIEVKALEGIEENIVKVEARNDMTDVNIQAEEVNVDVLEIGTYQHF